MSEGEVAIRENGSVTAVATETLDGEVAVNLDHDPPLVGVPDDVATFHETGLDDLDDESDEAVPDGGYVRDDVRIRHYGLGLTGDSRIAALAIMSFAYAASGYLWANHELIAGLVAFLAAALATYVLTMYDRGEGDE